MKIDTWVSGRGGGGLSLGDGGIAARLKEHTIAGYLSHDGERDEVSQQRNRPTLREKHANTELWKLGDRKQRETMTR